MLLLGLEEVTVLQIISVEPSPTRVCRLYQALLEVLGTEPCQERQAPIHEGPGRKVTVTDSDALRGCKLECRAVGECSLLLETTC